MVRCVRVRACFYFSHSLTLLFSISFSVHGPHLYIFYVCTFVFLVYLLKLPLMLTSCACIQRNAFNFRRIFRLCVRMFVYFAFLCVVVEKNVVTVLIYSIREFTRGKYMRKRVNVREFKRNDNSDI